MEIESRVEKLFWQVIKENLRNYSMFIMLAIIMIGFALLTDGVNLNPRNFTNIFIQNSYILILAIGMVLVIIVGNIDLSVGSVAAFTGAIAAIVYNTGIGLVLTVMVTLLLGLAIGAYQGYWIAYQKIPAFIVTLSGMLLFRGLTYIITNVTPVTPESDGFKMIAAGTIWQEGLKIAGLHLLPLAIGVAIIILMVGFSVRGRRRKSKKNFYVLPLAYYIAEQVFFSVIILLLALQFSRYRGIPNVFVILGVTALIFTFITRNTVFGRYIYAVGGNSKAAKLSGINSEHVIFMVHTIMGGLAGLSGIVFTAYMNSALPAAGVLFELDAIAACFIGGASAAGGIGTIIGAIIGGLVMGAINNGMSLMNIGADWQYVVKALVLLLAVWYDIYTRKKSGMV